jgi:hypothetical protein
VDSNILKKLPILFIIVLLSIVFNTITQNSAEAAACIRDADNKIKVKDTPGSGTLVSHSAGTYDQTNCNEQPLFYKVKFYRFMVCTADPFVVGSGDTGAEQDFSSCVDIFNNAAGKDIIITPTGQEDLLEGDLVLPIGSYPFATVIVDNELKVKHQETFIEDTGGVPVMNGFHASTYSAGSICWSIDKTTAYTNRAEGNTVGGVGIAESYIKTLTDNTTKLGMACGTSVGSNYDYATEIIDSIDSTCDAEESPDCATTFRPYTGYESIGSIGAEMAGVLLQTDETTASTLANAQRIFGAFKLGTPLVITENIIGLELQFNTSESVSVDLQYDGSGDDIQAKKIGVEPFGIKFVVTNK